MTHRRLFVFSLLTAMVSACGGTPGPEILDQDITSDRTLVNRIEDPAAVDYLVVKDLGVSARLTIEPGVRIAFQSDTGLSVGDATGNGAIVAVGTEIDPILFEGESPGPGTWHGLGIGTPSAQNRLEWVIVRDGGQAPVNALFPERAGVTLWDGRLSMVDTRIEGSKDIGFYVATSVGGMAPVLDTFKRNTLTGNEGRPARITSNLLGQIDESSTYSGNGTDEVVFYVPDFGPPIDGPVTVGALDVPYRIEGSLGLTQDVRITEGVTFHMATSSEIVVGSATGVGSLSIEGSAEALVTITGAVETAGSWGGIFVDSPSVLNHFTHLEIAHGGGTTPVAGEKANIVLGGDARLTVEGSVIRDSGGWGIFVNGGGTLTETSNTFRNNASGDLGS